MNRPWHTDLWPIYIWADHNRRWYLKESHATEPTELNQLMASKQMGGDESDSKSVMSYIAWSDIMKIISTVNDYDKKITLRMMRWIIMIMTMRFILIMMTKEAGRLWGAALFVPNIYTDKNVWQTFTPTIQRSLQHKTSFGGYIDVIIITTRSIFAKKGFETNWFGQLTTRGLLTIQPWGECKERIVCETLFDTKSFD